MRQQVLLNKIFQQMSNLKHMSYSKVKAPPYMHKDILLSRLQYWEQSEGCHSNHNSALSEKGGIYSTFPCLIQVSMLILQINLQDIDWVF